MSDLLAQLQMYFQYPFVCRALVVGVMIALCTSLLGVTLVLKRFSFIGDGLSHVAFGVMCVAAVMQLTNNMLLILPVTVLAAILLLNGSAKMKLSGDASIAVVSVSAMAIGYLIMNLFSASANVSGDVCTTLFGSTSILTLTDTDVWICAILSLLVIAIYIIFYNKIFAITFDEAFATATGLNTKVYNMMIAVISAIIIVLAMTLVGALLVSALIVFPALSAMRVFKSYRAVIIFAAVLSVFCTALGIIIAVLAGTPVGPTIVVADLITFLLFSVIGKVKGC